MHYTSEEAAAVEKDKLCVGGEVITAAVKLRCRIKRNERNGVKGTQFLLIPHTQSLMALDSIQ